jgi:hypothetical protein
MKKLPKMLDHREAQAFGAHSDLTKYDLSNTRKIRFDFDLEDQVGPVVDAMKADPSRAIPAKKVFAAIRAHHAAKMKAKKK